MKIYRFLPPKREDLLFGQNSIWFTPPAYFNDPFELRPVVRVVATKSFARAAIKGHTKGIFDLHPPPGYANLPRRRKRELIRRAERGFQHEWKERLAVQTAQYTAHNLPSDLSKEFGALCFSTELNNLLMWAHYTDSHNGFALEFDSKHPDFQALGELHKVEYHDERPTYDPSKKCDIRIYLTKSPHWQYEAEFRIFRSVKICGESSLSEDGRTLKLRTTAFPAKALTGIYFGVRSDPAFILKVKSLLPRNSVSFWRAELEDLTFGFRWMLC